MSARSGGGLNENEAAVLRVIASALEGVHLRAIAKKAFPRIAEQDAYNWAKNSVRRPLKRGLVAKVSKGTYKCTAAGRKAAAR